MKKYHCKTSIKKEERRKEARKEQEEKEEEEKEDRTLLRCPLQRLNFSTQRRQRLKRRKEGQIE